MPLPDPTAPLAESRELLDQLGSLIEELDSFHPYLPEDTLVVDMVSDHVPKVTRFLERGSDLLGRIERCLGRTPRAADGSSEPDSLRDIGILISAEVAAAEVTNRVSVAQGEVRASLEEVKRATKKQAPFLVASGCERSLDRLSKALTSVELSLAEFEQVKPPPRHLDDLELAVGTRRWYAILRGVIGPRIPPDRSSLRDRLKTTAHELVNVRQLPIYPWLRFDDRLRLRSLLKRVVRWLASEDSSDSEGLNIWRDLVTLSRLASDVSYRQVLREHDAALMEEVCATLFRHGTLPSRLPDEVRTRLGRLLGLSEELDEVLLSADSRPLEDLREPLLRLRKELRLRAL